MNWYPNYIKDDQEISALSNAALLATGKALHICNRFESTCKWVFQVAESIGYLQKNEGASLQEAFSNFKEKFLHGTIKGLGEISEIKKEELDTLERAKDARNYIAHESALFFAGTEKKGLIFARLKKLREEVQILAHGANLVFLWSYEIEHRELGPREIFKNYPDMVDNWVFGHIAKQMEVFESHSEVEKAEALLQKYFKKPNHKTKA